MSEALYEGLIPYEGTIFPRKCYCCGALFTTQQDFFRKTSPIEWHFSTGIKESSGDNGIVLEVFRNCSCGSTLLEIFLDRRDVCRQQTRIAFGLCLTAKVYCGEDMNKARASLLLDFFSEVTPQLSASAKQENPSFIECLSSENLSKIASHYAGSASPIAPICEWLQACHAALTPDSNEILKSFYRQYKELVSEALWNTLIAVGWDVASLAPPNV